MRGKRREWGKEGDRKPRARSGQSRKIPMHRGRGDGADRPTLHSIEGWKKSQQPKPLRCHVGPWMQSECRECMSVSVSVCVCVRRNKMRLCVSWARCAGASLEGR